MRAWKLGDGVDTDAVFNPVFQYHPEYRAMSIPK